MTNFTVRVLRSHISGPGQVAEVGDVLELPEHVATLRVNLGMCEYVPAPPPVLVEAPLESPQPDAATESGVDSGEALAAETAVQPGAEIAPPDTATPPTTEETPLATSPDPPVDPDTTTTAGAGKPGAKKGNR